MENFAAGNFAFAINYITIIPQYPRHSTVCQYTPKFDATCMFIVVVVDVFVVHIASILHRFYNTSGSLEHSTRGSKHKWREQLEPNYGLSFIGKYNTV